MWAFSRSRQTNTSDGGNAFRELAPSYSSRNDLILPDTSDTGFFDNDVWDWESSTVPDFTRIETTIQPSPVMSLRRLVYGKGKDARRTAKYIRYPISLSPVFLYLQARHIRITKIGLTELVMRLLEIIPPEQRPHGPTRNQKRVKGGLLYWLDHNARLIFPYLNLVLHVT
jgi:hypothetical protein